MAAMNPANAAPTARLEQHVRYLVAVKPLRSCVHPQGRDKAADFVCEQLQLADWAAVRVTGTAFYCNSNYHTERAAAATFDCVRLLTLLP